MSAAAKPSVGYHTIWLWLMILLAAGVALLAVPSKTLGVVLIFTVAAVKAFLVTYDYKLAGSVDLVFADPPYHLSNGGTTCHGGRRASVDKGAWDRSGGVAEDHAFQSRWLGACRRVLKPSESMRTTARYSSRSSRA